MTDKPTFTIWLPTYNRHELLEKSLRALSAQTYTNFEVLIYDRGSNPPVESIVSSFEDNRFQYIKSSQDEHGCDTGNEIIQNMKGKYFVFLSDDDIWTSKVLELTKKGFEENQNCNVVQIGLVSYNGKSNYQQTHLINTFNHYHFNNINSPVFEQFPGKKILESNLEWIFNKKEYNSPNKYYFHASGIFFRKEAIQSDKDLFFKPIGDAGYNFIFYQSTILYINLPLGILSVYHSDQESYSNRRRWIKELKHFEYVPTKVPTLFTSFAESILKTIYAHKLDTIYKPEKYLGPNFYLKQMKDVLSDNIIDFQTIKDIMIISPYLAKSCLENPTQTFKNLIPRSPIRAFKKSLAKFLNKIFIKNNDNQAPKEMNSKYFEDILEYATWVDNTFIKSRSL